MSIDSLSGWREEILAAVLTSLEVSVVAVLAILVPAYGTALLLAGPGGRWRGVLAVLVHFPLVLPPVVVGYVALLVLGRQGLLGPFLAALDIRLPFTRSGAILVTGIMVFPLMVRQLRLALEGIDPDLAAAARVLGVSPFRVFLTLTLPLSLPGIISGTALSLAAAMGEFGAVVTFAGDIPGETRTLPLAIYAAVLRPDGDMLALALTCAAIAMAATILGLGEGLQRRVRRLLFAGRTAP